MSIIYELADLSDRVGQLERQLKPSDWGFGVGLPSGPAQSLDILPLLQEAAQILSTSPAAGHISLLHSVSLYCNPHVPWSNSELSRTALEITNKALPTVGDDFFNHIRPNVVSLPKSSIAGRNRKNRAPGLRPGLGPGGSSQKEDDARREWKTNGVSALLLVYALMMPELRQEPFWPVLSAFVLNVLDDSDPVFRAQGCFLADHMVTSVGEILGKTGLADAFLDSVQGCLHYLPNLTDAEVSLYVLQAAYPVVFVLLKQKDLFSGWTELLEKHVMALIRHVNGRENDLPKNHVLLYLLKQAALVVQRLADSILVCMLRLNFLLNQLVVDPFLLDTEGGFSVALEALRVHHVIIHVFSSQEGKARLFSYKYDFLAAWAVLLKRLRRFFPQNKDAAVVSKQIELNLGLLVLLAQLLDEKSQNEKTNLAVLKEDVQAIASENTDLADLPDLAFG